MFNRRHFLSTLAALPLAGRGIIGAARAEEKLVCTKAELTEDGLHNQPWFIQNSFLDLAEELNVAKERGKRFVIIMERKNCPYCAKMHAVNFMRPEVCDFVRRHFAILQINKLGSREVTDFDGQTLPENKWTRKYNAFYTPNIMFFGEDAQALAKRPPLERLVARIEGYWEPDMFLEMFRYVWAKGYEKGSFVHWLKTQAKSAG